MDESQRKGMNMILVLVISAILCASATLIAVMLVSNRTTAEESTTAVIPDQVMIGEKLIDLETDPDKDVILAETVDDPEPRTDNVEQQSSEEQLEPQTESVEAEVPTPVPEPIIFVSYRVQTGDTLFSIARVHNTTIELMAVYGIGGDDMVAGTDLTLPIANPAYCPGMQAYVVRENDTVFSIAQALGSTPESIIGANSLGPGAIIYTTNVLCIP